MPPRYSLSKLKKLEDKIKDTLVSANFGYKILDGTSSSAIIDYILTKIASDGKTSEIERREVVASMLTDFMGTELSNIALTKIARRVSGWSKYINQGKLFRKWDMQRPVWACLKIIDVEPILWKPKKFLVTFTSYSGSTANMEWQQIFSGSFLRFLIKTIGGLRGESYSPYNAFNLWLTAVVHYEKARFSLSHVCLSSSQQTRNRKLLKARKGRCIGSFTDGTCFNCPLGIDGCGLARHPTTYPKGVCRAVSPGQSGKHKGYIQKDGYCMQCVKTGNYTTKSFKKHKEKPVEESKAKDIRQD